MSAKSALRKIVNEQIKQLSQMEVGIKSAEICKIIGQTLEWEKAEVVCIFAPLHGEPNLELLEMNGRRVCYPRVNGRELDLYDVSDPQAMESSPWGIREPIQGIHSFVNLKEIDLIFVPGLAFSYGGGRLGRGAGFYDRLFARPGWRARKMGVGFDCQLVSELPIEGHDHLLDGVITESGVFMSSIGPARSDHCPVGD